MGKLVKIGHWILVFMLVLCSLAYAQGVNTQQNIINNDLGLEIIYPKQIYLELNAAYKFNIHVFDTNGTILDNTTTNCTLHLYNESGKHLIETYNNMYYEYQDFRYNIPSGMLNHTGVYPYNAWCFKDNKVYGGFISGNFIVTPTGKMQRDATFAVGAVILIPLFIILVFLLVAWLLPGEKYPALKIGLIIGSLVFIFPAYGFASVVIGNFYDMPMLVDMIGDNTYYYGLVYVLIISVILITFIYDIFMLFSKKKQTGNYDDEER